MKGDSASVLSDAATLVPDKNQPSDVSRESDRGLDFNSVRYGKGLLEQPHNLDEDSYANNI